MDIFNEYTKLIEEFILTSLNQRQSNIDINSFLSELRFEKNRKLRADARDVNGINNSFSYFRSTSTQFDGEIYEFLFSLTDFQTFKQLILDYKESKLNENTLSALEECFIITKLWTDEAAFRPQRMRNKVTKKEFFIKPVKIVLEFVFQLVEFTSRKWNIQIEIFDCVYCYYPSP